MSIKHLERKEVLNIVYTLQADRMADAYAKVLSELDDAMVNCFTAELEASKVSELEAENARLKAEVERLTSFTTRTIIPNEELQAQVERLTKAGYAYSDAMDRLAMFANEDARLMARTASIAFKDALNAKEGKGQP